MTERSSSQDEQEHLSASDKYAIGYERIFGSKVETIVEPNIPATTESDLTQRVLTSISDSTRELLSISDTMAAIAKQGGWDAFWGQGDNIKGIASHVARLTTVQKSTLDLIVLIIGAAGTMKADYNIIIESIEELSREHGGSVEVLDYLVKIKQMVIDLQKRDAIIQDLLKNMQSMQADVLSVGSSSSSALKIAHEVANDSANLKKDLSALCSQIEHAHDEVHNTNSMLAETQQKALKEMAVMVENVSAVQARLAGHLTFFRFFAIAAGSLMVVSIFMAILAILK